jgi:hypothetical protein
VARAAARGEKLGVDTLNQIAGRSLDKGVELDALKGMKKLADPNNEPVPMATADAKPHELTASVDISND